MDWLVALVSVVADNAAYASVFEVEEAV